MEQRIIQPSLFEKGSFIGNKLIFENQKKILVNKKFIPNLADAFGITKTDLSKIGFKDLRIMFYGAHNLEINPEVPIIQNPAETLAYVFSAGLLKKGNKHLGLPRNVFMLVDHINRFAYNNKGFRSFAFNLKEYFDSSPGKQRERLQLLILDARWRFMNSFFEPYKFSNREKQYDYDFFDSNWDGISEGRDSGKYVDGIHGKVKSWSDKANELWR